MSELLVMRKKLLISFEAIVSMLAVMIQIFVPNNWFNGLPDQLKQGVRGLLLSYLATVTHCVVAESLFI